MYWDETPSQSAKYTTAAAPHGKIRDGASRERQEYRLAAYRRAQERFRDAMASGAGTRTAATWRALQDVCSAYTLEPAELGLLIHCLMTPSS
jgi:hypothetical protein